jgi:poly(3-hydroxybutyrate) depolymerase
VKITRVPLLLVVALAACASAAQEPGATASRARDGRPRPLVAHQTGEFVAILPRRSPESAPARWAQRYQGGGDLSSWDYDLAKESFSLYVPSDYDRNGDPYGMVVWVSPFSDGSIPEGLKRAFDERRLIWIGPNNVGNDRHIYQRSGLSLDAVENMKGTYNVDPDRIYVSGLSGGGKMAAMMAVDYPEIFAGGFPIIGMTTYLRVPLESSPGQAVARFPAPAPDVLSRARRQPLVIMTGSGDFNREECRLTAAAYEQDGFEHLHLIDIDGMGHEMPTPENFARGLDLLLADSD